MEFIEYAVLLMGIFIGCSFLIFLLKRQVDSSKNKVKTITKDPEKEVLKQTIKTLQEQFGTIEVEYKKKIKQLNGIINRNQYQRTEADEEEEEESVIDTENYVFDKEMVRPMLNNWGMNTDALDNPLLQNIIFEKVKGNEEILITLGILKPKNQTTENDSESSSSSSKLPTDTITNWA